MTQPKKAPAAIRHQILNCLRDEQYRIHPDGQRYLDIKNLRPELIIKDLIADLELFHIFHLPPEPGSQSIKYQYVIRYSDPDLLIHVKFTPKDEEPPIVFLTFHSHNSGYHPLPLLPIEPPMDS